MSQIISEANFPGYTSRLDGKMYFKNISRRCPRILGFD